MAGAEAEEGLAFWEWRGYRLAYLDRGRGPRTVVLIHGLTLPACVNEPLAQALVAAGYRVLQPELLGHGRSDRPVKPTLYRLDLAATQVTDLLDELGLQRAVVGGMSLGANVSLELASRHPQRFAGIICEMPVLERGTVGALAVLAPLWALLRFGRRPMSLVFRAARAMPRTGNAILDTVLGVPGTPEEVAAVLQGYASGPAVPPLERRRQIQTPALVIAHGRDLIHPLDDGERLAGQLPDARLVHAHSGLEMRRRPGRLCREVVAFVDDVFQRDRDRDDEERLA